VRNYYQWQTYKRISDGAVCNAIGFTGTNKGEIESLSNIVRTNPMKVLANDKGLHIEMDEGVPPLILNFADWLVWDGKELTVWNPNTFTAAFVEF
jgi:hypothetical protein